MPPHFQKNVEAARYEDKREDILPFAVDRIDLVEGIVKAVKAERIPSHAAQFCRTLTGILSQAKSGIQVQQQTDKSANHEIANLLDELEWLCSYGKSSSRKKTEARRWPTLGNLAADKQMVDASDCLRNFSCRSGFKSRKEFLDKLKGGLPDLRKSCDQANPPASHGDTTSSITRSKILEEDIREETETLCIALRAYRSCNSEGSVGNIITKIRISGCVRLHTSSAEFGVLFLGHPHAQDCRWKEARILISPGKSNFHPSDLSPGGKARGVRFVENVPAQSSTLNSPPVAPIAYDEFCHRVSRRDQARLSLWAEDGRFIFQQKLDTSREWLPDHQAISLAELLGTERGHITPKMKAVLAYLLAKAVWQFYDSELLGKGLTKNEVYFLFERRGTIQGVYIDEPMVMTHFGRNPSDPNPNENYEDEGTHDMPKILALGIMLLELETNTFIEDHRNDPDLNPGGVLDVDTDYKIAKRLVDDQDPCHILSELPITSPLRTVLPLCIKAGELQNRFDIKSSAKKKTTAPVRISRSDGLRATIYNEIVQPLEQSRRQYVDLQNMKVLRKLTFGPTTARTNWQAMVTLAKQTPQQLSTSQNPKTGNPDVSEEFRELSRGWFRDFERLKQVLRPRGAERGPGYKPVKIAVLDTGIHAEDYEDHNAEGVIGGYRDFVDRANGEVRRGGTEHGTIAASLLVKVCPDGILFLARVLETKNARENEVQNVVDAIAWAIGKEVDIITMAIGFDEHQPAIEKAVRNARARGILIFSAASNKRNTSEIYCPANIHDCVFGIFATNAGNREARDLNPSMSLGGRPHCFAIFGEHVEWREFKPLVKGTSYSTSIAAGLAALLLQFPRQTHDEDRSADLANLKEMMGMVAVFRKMSKKDGSCDCIRPWSLLNNAYETKNWDPAERSAMRKKQRDWIRATIEQSLYDMYRPN